MKLSQKIHLSPIQSHFNEMSPSQNSSEKLQSDKLNNESDVSWNSLLDSFKSN